jgi:hypothetical protein
MTTSMETEQRGFVHSALFYQSQREYLDFVTRFVLDGLEIDEPVLVAVPGEQLTSLGDALRRAGASTAALHMTDISEVGRNPSRFLAIEADFVAKYPEQRVRIVSQLAWPGRTTDEAMACVQHEALVNGEFANRNVMGLCLYDASRLDDDVLQGARTTHPLLWKCGAYSAL